MCLVNWSSESLYPPFKDMSWFPNSLFNWSYLELIFLPVKTLIILLLAKRALYIYIYIYIYNFFNRVSKPSCKFCLPYIFCVGNYLRCTIISITIIKIIAATTYNFYADGRRNFLNYTRIIPFHVKNNNDVSKRKA